MPQWAYEEERKGPMQQVRMRQRVFEPEQGERTQPQVDEVD